MAEEKEFSDGTTFRSSRVEGASIFVVIFGLVVAGSLVLQAFIPFLQKMAEDYGWTGPAWLALVNRKFVLPIKLITDFWAWISAAYIGVDRAAFSVQAFKDANKPGKVDFGQKGHILQIIIESLIVYALAVLLNFFLDAEFALESLFASVGFSTLLYVSGNKVLKAADKVGEDSDKLEANEKRDARYKLIDSTVARLKEGERAVIAIETERGRYKVIGELQ